MLNFMIWGETPLFLETPICGHVGRKFHQRIYNEPAFDWKCVEIFFWRTWLIGKMVGAPWDGGPLAV